MGLAGFNRARQRNLEGAVKAPSKPIVQATVIPKEKNYCPHCDKYFNNFTAYEGHMQLKHTKEYVDSNPGCVITPAMQRKLDAINGLL